MQDQFCYSDKMLDQKGLSEYILHRQCPFDHGVPKNRCHVFNFFCKNNLAIRTAMATSNINFSMKTNLTQLLWNFVAFLENLNFYRNLQDSDSIGWSSSLAPSGDANNLLTRFNKSVFFAIIHTILDPFINIFGPIFSTLIWNNEQIS